ncbi:DUF1648 domain-containing protein [Occultella gossypii]|uniref:DUF1648 domain-containing protein n=1 Tax=Occultella gossypii TaxID=2800820 RepID=A0ABS7S726_9MICO|nr:DUF1648 domain-containing protein [Occultella gossypii]MBZ2196157.1 DUF1648 domain-containing protein [Occultella gossypii]
MTAATHEPRIPVPHRARRIALGAVLPALLLGSACALVLAWRDRLPDPVAVHWGVSGVDRTGSFAELVAPMLILGLATLAVTATLSVVTGRSGLTRRMTVGLSAGMAAMYAVMFAGMCWVQLDVPTAEQAGDPGFVIALSLLALAGVGVVAGALAGSDPPQAATGDVAADAARLALGPTETAVWIRTVTTARPWLLWTLVVVVLAGSAVLGALTGQWWLIPVLAATAALVAATASWTVRVDARGLSARGVYGWPRIQVPADEVERADAITISPFAEFGGWGLRTDVRGRTGLVVRKGSAISIQRTGGRVVVVTVPDAERGAALLNTVAARARTAPMPDGGSSSGRSLT